ncbi:hypothetical protein H5410_026131, partial [Solanum commersonii]
MVKRERTLSLKGMETQASQPNRGNRKKNGKASANFGKKSSSSGGRSWTDEVDDESVKPVHQSSIWDNFDIAKISNVRFKLEYVEPIMHGESPAIEIESEDMTHPPFEVLKGFIHRLWSKLGINKVAILKNVGNQVVLQGGGICHFDNKPLISLQGKNYIPIWIKLFGLDFKYWSPKGLSKIGSLVGKLVMMDHNTERKVRLNFARLLVEVQMDTMLPEVILFKLEKGYLKEQKVLYDWKPMLCKICDKYGHSKVNCGKRNTSPGTKKGGTGSKGDVGQDFQPSIDTGGIVVQEKLSPPTIALDPHKAGISDEFCTNDVRLRRLSDEEIVGGHPNPIIGNGSCLCWNIRGLNGPNKQKEVKCLCNNEKIRLAGLLEIKIKVWKIDLIAQKIFDDGLFITSLVSHYNGRIWITWRLDYYTVTLIESTSQLITCEMRSVPMQQTFIMIMVYAYNTKEGRKELWDSLMDYNMILGDFNLVLTTEDIIGGNPVVWSEIEDFQNCIATCGFIEVKDTLGMTK